MGSCGSSVVRVKPDETWKVEVDAPQQYRLKSPASNLSTISASFEKDDYAARCAKFMPEWSNDVPDYEIITQDHSDAFDKAWSDIVGMNTSFYTDVGKKGQYHTHLYNVFDKCIDDSVLGKHISKALRQRSALMSKFLQVIRSAIEMRSTDTPVVKASRKAMIPQLVREVNDLQFFTSECTEKKFLPEWYTVFFDAILSTLSTILGNKFIPVERILQRAILRIIDSIVLCTTRHETKEDFLSHPPTRRTSIVSISGSPRVSVSKRPVGSIVVLSPTAVVGMPGSTGDSGVGLQVAAR